MHMFTVLLLNELESTIIFLQLIRVNN